MGGWLSLFAIWASIPFKLKPKIYIVWLLNTKIIGHMNNSITQPYGTQEIQIVRINHQASTCHLKNIKKT